MDHGLAIALWGAGCRLDFPRQIRQEILPIFLIGWWFPGIFHLGWWSPTISSEWSSQLTQLNMWYGLFWKNKSCRSFEDLWTIERSILHRQALFSHHKLSKLSEEMFHPATATVSFRPSHRDQIEKKIHATILQSVHSDVDKRVLTFDPYPL